MAADISIYQISHNLLDLMARYADLQEELVVSPEQAEATGKAIEDLDKEITAFLGSELVKDRIDGVSGFLLMAKGRAKEARAEAARLTRAADSWEHREKRLKGYLQNVMENAGLKRLEGRTSIMRIQANGGVDPPPLVSQPELVPDDLCVWEGRLSHNAWQAMCLYRFDVQLGCDFKRVPSPALIKAELDKPCGSCGGSGQEIGTAFPEVIMGQCSECGGTGRNAVPGCSLQTRGQHVRIC